MDSPSRLDQLRTGNNNNNSNNNTCSNDSAEDVLEINPQRTLYGLLGVTASATEEQLAVAFRQIVKSCHPQLSSTPNMKRFLEAGKAFKILSTPSSRAFYDQNGYYTEDMLRDAQQHTAAAATASGMHDGVQKIPPVAPMTNEEAMREVFSMPDFLDRVIRNAKSPSVDLAIKLSLAEMYRSEPWIKELDFFRHDFCHSCNGKGMSQSSDCVYCGGEGRVRADAHSQETLVCPNCEKCQECGGAGLLDVDFKLQIPVKPGIRDGDTITVEEMAGCVKGKRVPGNVNVKMMGSYSNDLGYRVQGSDLLLKQQISLIEALTGYSFEVQLPDKHKIVVQSERDEVASPGSVKIIKDAGMPINSQSRGRLLIEFSVSFPERLTPEQKAGIKAALRPKLTKSEFGAICSSCQTSIPLDKVEDHRCDNCVEDFEL